MCKFKSRPKGFNVDLPQAEAEPMHKVKGCPKRFNIDLPQAEASSQGLPQEMIRNECMNVGSSPSVEFGLFHKPKHHSRD
jgi:hypothetical protein